MSESFPVTWDVPFCLRFSFARVLFRFFQLYFRQTYSVQDTPWSEDMLVCKHVLYIYILVVKYIFLHRKYTTSAAFSARAFPFRSNPHYVQRYTIIIHVQDWHTRIYVMYCNSSSWTARTNVPHSLMQHRTPAQVCKRCASSSAQAEPLRLLPICTEECRRISAKTSVDSSAPYSIRKTVWRRDISQSTVRCVVAFARNCAHIIWRKWLTLKHVVASSIIPTSTMVDSIYACKQNINTW